MIHLGFGSSPSLLPELYGNDSPPLVFTPPFVSNEPHIPELDNPFKYVPKAVGSEDYKYWGTPMPSVSGNLLQINPVLAISLVAIIGLGIFYLVLKD